jgi:hypothetical protein
MPLGMEMRIIHLVNGNMNIRIQIEQKRSNNGTAFDNVLMVTKRR